MKYSDKLRDPRWQKMRLEVFGRAQFACEHCLESENTLHAHHNYYVSRREPWEYPADSISCLCEECHSEITERKGMVIPAGDEEILAVPEWERSAALALKCNRSSQFDGGESIADTIFLMAGSSSWPEQEAVNILGRLSRRHADNGGLLNRLLALEKEGVL